MAFTLSVYFICEIGCPVVTLSQTSLLSYEYHGGRPRAGFAGPIYVVFLPTSSTIEINVSDVSLFKLTNIFAGQDYTSKQRKTDDFLFYNRSDLGRFHFHVTLWLVLAESGACEGSSCPGRYYTTLTL